MTTAKLRMQTQTRGRIVHDTHNLRSAPRAVGRRRNAPHGHTQGGRNMKPSTRAALDRYRDGHIEPGGFCRAVLENNLLQAVSFADPENLHDIPEIVEYVWNELPASSWGSPERVTAWLAQRPATTGAAP